MAKSIELSSHLYGGRPEPFVVGFLNFSAKFSCLLPLLLAAFGIYLVRFYSSHQFMMKIYIDICFLILFSYVVVMFFGTAYAWAPLPIFQQ